MQGLDLALDHGRLQTLVEVLEAVHLERVLAKHLRVLKLLPCGATEARAEHGIDQRGPTELRGGRGVHYGGDCARHHQ